MGRRVRVSERERERERNRIKCIENVDTLVPGERMLLR